MSSLRCLLTLLLIVAATVEAVAQNSVNVNDGEVIRRSDLDAGMFNGQSFVLEPETTFEINSGGEIISGIYDFAGSTVNIHSGGQFRASRIFNVPQVNAVTNGVVNLTPGGSVDDNFRLDSGSIFNMTGGLLTGNNFGFEANAGSITHLSGGVIDIGPLQFHSGSSGNFIGGDFQLNGAPVNDLSVGLSSSDIFTGTLEDGRVFVLDALVSSVIASNQIAAGTVSLNTTIAAPDTTPIAISSGSGPVGLRPGQQLTLSGTSSVGAQFTSVSSTLDIAGGSVGRFADFAYSEINLFSGGIDVRADALQSIVNVYGGNINDSFTVQRGTEFNLFGGSVARLLMAIDGSEVNVAGGEITGDFELGEGAILNVSGGDLGYGFRAEDGAQVNLFVNDLFIDGVAIDLESGEQMVITQRGGSLLQATLRDGQFLDLVLNDSFVANQDFIANGATLTVIGVPEPATPVLAGLFVTIAAAGIRRRREQRRID